MSQSFIDAIKKSINQECNAAKTFMALAEASDDPNLIASFLSYAQEELSHGVSLLRYLGKELAQDALPLELEYIPPVENLHVSLIEYLAEEEAAIFYYESLARLAPDRKSQDFFMAIRDEEHQHMEFLENLIQEKEESQ